MWRLCLYNSEAMMGLRCRWSRRIQRSESWRQPIRRILTTGLLPSAGMDLGSSYPDCLLLLEESLDQKQELTKSAVLRRLRSEFLLRYKAQGISGLVQCMIQLRLMSVWSLEKDRHWRHRIPCFRSGLCLTALACLLSFRFLILRCLLSV